MSTPIQSDPAAKMGLEDPLTPYTKKWIRRFLYFSFLNFIIAGTLALFMRTDQAGSASNIGPLGTAQVFGQLLTAHGLGMFVGWQFPFAYGLCMYVFPKYMKRKLYNEKLLPVIFTLFLAGFYTVWLSTAVGFGPGWYFLFPLPFHSGPLGSWGNIQALLFFAGMIVTNMSLPVFAYEVFATAFSSKYNDKYNNSAGMNTSISAKFAGSIGFTSYMPKLVRTRILNYPVATVAAMITTIDMIISVPPFLVLLSDGAWISMNNQGFLNNLIAKNFLWINYHPIVYFAFFPLIGMYYTLLPIFSKRNFSSSRWVYAPWPLLLVSAVGVYSHHLFMDTAQPFLLQLTAQNMSMLVSLASGISVFTLMALIWRSNYEYNLTAKFFIASIFGWVIGGIMGAEQGNASMDIYMHNTYAVVSHFHFNALDGIILAAFGVLYYILPELSGKQWYSKTLGEIHFWTTCIGGFGLAFVFAAMGYLGVARRQWQPVSPLLPFTVTLNYQFYLDLALFFALFVAAAQIPFIWNLLKTLTGPTVTTEVTPASLEELQVSVPATAPMVHSIDESQSKGIGLMGGAIPNSAGIGLNSVNQTPKHKEID
ncbi:MAG: cbb3-type cytochrome c oxidase subunit I [Nitrososphaerales archaeon]